MLNIIINEQIILVSIIAVSLLIIGFIVYTFIKDKKEDQSEIDELMNNIIDSKPKEITEVTFKDAVNKIETKSEIEEMLDKMQKDLETKSDEVVEKFEKEQEEKSIISYDELVKNKEKVTKIEEKELRPISIVELNDDNDFEENEPVKKFKKTDFISPVYGKMDEKLEYPKVPVFDRVTKSEDEMKNFEMQFSNHNIDDYLEDYNNNIEIDNLEKTLNMPPINEEIKKNEDFLQALKDFRNNL